MVDRDRIIELERRHVWPPYTSSERHETHEPLVIASAEGMFLTDVDGTRYYDATSSWWTATLGHRHPRLVEVVRRESERLFHVAAGGATHEHVAELARELASVAPRGLTRTHFSDDGSTAVEVATKIAFQYWQQNGKPSARKFVALAGAYHGDTLGAASLASLEEFHGIFGPLFFEVLHAPHPSEHDGWSRVLETLESMFEREADQIAAMVVEPLVQGASGMRMHSPEVLRALHELARRHDILFVADEVFTGYGRTGSMFACEQAGITPDLLCLAKGFTAGVLPMAATMATDRIYEGFRGGPSRALMHGHTFSGHPLGAAVAREVLAIMRDEQVLAGLRARSAKLEASFARIASIPGVLRVRTLGAIAAADLGDVGYGGSAIGHEVTREARRRGVHLRPLGDTIYVTPPLNAPLDELDTLLGLVEESIGAALEPQGVTRSGARS